MTTLDLGLGQTAQGSLTPTRKHLDPCAQASGERHPLRPRPGAASMPDAS